jgi:hypothetical protein
MLPGSRFKLVFQRELTTGSLSLKFQPNPIFLGGSGIVVMSKNRYLIQTPSNFSTKDRSDIRFALRTSKHTYSGAICHKKHRLSLKKSRFEKKSISNIPEHSRKAAFEKVL